MSQIKILLSAIIVSFMYCHAAQQPSNRTKNDWAIEFYGQKKESSLTPSPEQHAQARTTANNRILLSLKKTAEQDNKLKQEKLVEIEESNVKRFINELRAATYYERPNAENLFVQKLQTLQEEESFSSEITQTITAIPLLEDLLKGPFPPKSAIYELLGILYSHKGDRANAEKNFAASEIDPLALYNGFILSQNTDTVTTTAQNSIILTALIAQVNSQNTRAKQAQNLINNYLIANGALIIKYLLEGKNYELADAFATLLLNNESTAHITIERLNELWIQICTKKESDTLTMASHNINRYLGMLHICSACQTFLGTSYEQHPENVRYRAALLYNSMGASLKNMAYLDLAIAYGDTSAMYNKADLLLSSLNLTTEKETECLDLLKQCVIHNCLYSADAANTLAQLYYENNLEKNFLDHTPVDNEQSYKYLQQALHLGNNKCVPLLGLLHYHGIQKNNHFILERNPQLALECLSQYNESSVTTLEKEIYYTRGILNYEQGNFQKALKDFQAISLKDLTLQIQANISMYQMASLLKIYNEAEYTPEEQTKCVHHLLEVLDKGAYNSSINHLQLIDQETQNNLLEKTASIMINHNFCKKIEHQQTEESDLLWCYFVGKLYTGKLFLNNEEHVNYSHGLVCLKHSADEGLYAAQLTAGCLKKSSLLPLPLRVNYLLKAHKYASKNTNVPYLETTPKIILNASIPSNLVSHYKLLELYCEDGDNEATILYLKSLFSTLYIIVDRSIDETVKNNLIRECSENKLLQAYARSFIAKPQTSTKVMQKAAALVGIIYGYSKDENQLVQSVNYLEKLHNNSLLTDLCATHLPISYYNLGLCYEQKKPAQAFSLFHSAALLKYQPAINKVIQATTKKAIQSGNVHKTLTNIIDHGLQQAHKEATPAKQARHQHMALLIHGSESSFTQDSIFQETLSLSSTASAMMQYKEQLESLSRKTPAHPHASLSLSLLHWRTNNTRQKQGLCELYIKKAFEQAVTKVNNNTRFIDEVFLGVLCEYIQTATTATAKTVPPVIRTLIKTIGEKGINMEIFKKYVNEVTGINLDNYK